MPMESLGDHEGHDVERGLLAGFGTAFSLPGTRPLKLFLDTTNKCNLRCIMCHFAYDSAQKTSMVQWTPEFLARLERDVLPYTWHAQLSLGTEPLIWRHFTLLLDACKRAGVPIIDMYTNGVLLTKTLARKIVETPMSRVQFSLEGVTRKGFEEVRIGASFQRFVRAVEMLAEARRSAGSEYPRLQFNITMLRRNADEIEDILHLAHRLGVDYLDFRHVVLHDGLGIESDSYLNDKAGYNLLMARLRALAAELGLVIVVQPDDFELPGETKLDPGGEVERSHLVELQEGPERTLGSERTSLERSVQPPGRAFRPRLFWWRERFRMRRLFNGLRERLGGDGAAKVYGVTYVKHDLPQRLPAGAVYPARVTLQNEGNFVWRCVPTVQDGIMQRGEVALVIQLDGKWVDTRKIPVPEVAPGGQVAVEFPLQAPSEAGEHVLGLDLIEWDVTQFREVGVEPLTLPWSIDEAWPSTSGPCAAKFYGVQYLEHNIPSSLPAGSTYQATIALKNEGSFVWRCSVPSRANWTQLQRGEVALVIRLNGEWVATGLLPRSEVRPGEKVAIPFALRVPPNPSLYELSLDLVEWDVTHFKEVGAESLTVPLEVQEAESEPSVICELPWREFVVRPDGSVVPCTFWYTPDTMGDLREQSFLEIWEGTAYRRRLWYQLCQVPAARDRTGE
jgi:MoaA/NifB/PqqE/SkfB family radical SAM enzyme